MPRSSTRSSTRSTRSTRRSISTLGPIAIVTALVLHSPRGGTTLAARSVVIPVSVIATGPIVVTTGFTTLLPGSHITLGRWRSTLLPGLGITFVRIATPALGASFNTARLVFTRSTTRQLVHKLLSRMLVSSLMRAVNERELTSISRSTASPVPIARGPRRSGAGPLRQSLPLWRSGQSRAMWPALPQTRQMMLAVKLRCSGQSYLRCPI